MTTLSVNLYVIFQTPNALNQTELLYHILLGGKSIRPRKPTRTKEILAEMLTDGIIVPEGQNKNRTYKLK